MGETRIAFLFPGQGSQTVGMGKELAEKYPIARQTFEEADHVLGYRLSDICWTGPEEKLRLTEITQPAILATSVAAWRVLDEKGLSPHIVAGHSLGEYAAHCAAGTLDFGEALRTVRNRGKYMQEAVPVGVGAMAAILGLDVATVEAGCAEAAQGQICSPANINSPSQVVIAGNGEAVDRACEILKNKGAKRAIRLNVSAPFHCALMRPAQERLSFELEQVAFNHASIPVVTNVDARITTEPAELRDALFRQVSAPVKWSESVDLLLQQGVKSFVEVGPGKVLSGLMRQINRDANCLNIEDSASLEAARAKLNS